MYQRAQASYPLQSKLKKVRKRRGGEEKKEGEVKTGKGEEEEAEKE